MLLQGTQQHLWTGTSSDCFRGHTGLLLWLQSSREPDHFGAMSLRYDWEVLQKKGVAEFKVKHSVLRKYKQDWSFGHEKGQCEPGEFLWLQHWGSRLRGCKDRRLDFLPNCSIFHVLQFEDSIVYKLGNTLFISQDFRGTLGLENYYFI